MTAEPAGKGVRVGRPGVRVGQWGVRVGQAVDLTRTARQPDGTWLQEGRHAGRAWFEVDVAPGQPSPWLTLVAARLLRWWDAR